MEEMINYLSAKESQALSEILISSKSLTGVNKTRILKLLRTRDEDAIYMFIRKVNDVFRGALKIIYDEEKDRCIAIARANRRFVQEVLEDKHVALLMFMYYMGMTSRTRRITFEEIHTYFQRSSLYAERRLLAALDHLVKFGFLTMREETDGEEKKRVYFLTEAAKHVFPHNFLKRVLSESQGGEVTFEQVRDFFNTGRQQTEDGDQEDETQIKLL
jgi:DNA-binding PadR family transcriptional regulator